MAVNVATALAQAAPDSTLLIDLNVACGDAAVFLGAEPRFSVMDASRTFSGSMRRSSAASWYEAKPALDLLGASGRPVTGASNRRGFGRCSILRA